MKRKDSAGGRQPQGKDGKSAGASATTDGGKILPLPVARRAAPDTGLQVPVVEGTSPERRRRIERAAMDVRRFLLLEGPDLAEALGHSELAAKLLMAASTFGGHSELEAVVQAARAARSMFIEYQRDMSEVFGVDDVDPLEAAVYDEFVAVLQRLKPDQGPQTVTLKALAVRLAERELNHAEARARLLRRLLAGWSVAVPDVQ